MKAPDAVPVCLVTDACPLCRASGAALQPAATAAAVAVTRSILIDQCHPAPTTDLNLADYQEQGNFSTWGPGLRRVGAHRLWQVAVLACQKIVALNYGQFLRLRTVIWGQR